MVSPVQFGRAPQAPRVVALTGARAPPSRQSEDSALSALFLSPWHPEHGRTFSMTGRSRMVAMNFSSPPQVGQCAIGKMFPDSPRAPRIRRPRIGHCRAPADGRTCQFAKVAGNSRLARRGLSSHSLTTSTQNFNPYRTSGQFNWRRSGPSVLRVKVARRHTQAQPPAANARKVYRPSHGQAR